MVFKLQIKVIFRNVLQHALILDGNVIKGIAKKKQQINACKNKALKQI